MTGSLKQANNAFSLIELLVVIFLLAIISSVVLFSMTSSASRATLEDQINALEHFDLTTRIWAKHHGQAITLNINPQSGSFSRVYENKQEKLSALNLNSNFSITELRTWPKQIIETQLKLPFSKEGHSPTYAMKLAQGKQSQWLLITGLTGEVSWHEEDEIDIIFNALEGSR